MIDGFVRLMETPCKVTGPINLGNPREMQIGELAETVLRMTGSQSKLIQNPLPSDDPVKRKPDITRARDTLGWEPKVSLEEGLVPVISYFADVLSLPVPAEVQSAARSRA
jgi:UDP-glucuronate decarboxylase